MKKRELFFFATSLLLALLVITGCGDTDDVEEAVEEAVEEVVEEIDEVDETDEATIDDEAIFETSQWVQPESYEEFVATVKAIKYRVGEVGGESISISYLHEGTEEVSGISTDKVSIDMEDEGSFTMWVDSEGTVQRIIADGEELPAEMADMITAPLMSMVMLPFHQASALDAQAMAASPVPGVSQNHLETGTENYGDLSANVHRVEISVEPPAVPEGESGKAILHFADFGDFQMVTGWEVQEMDGQSFSGEFKIEEITLR